MPGRENVVMCALSFSSLHSQGGSIAKSQVRSLTICFCFFLGTRVICSLDVNLGDLLNEVRVNLERDAIIHRQDLETGGDRERSRTTTTTPQLMMRK